MFKSSLKIPNFYSDSTDAHHRLNNTVNRYKGEFYCFIVDGDKFRLYHPESGAHCMMIDIHDPDIDISIPRMGYVNIPANVGRRKSKKSVETHVFYAFRPPVRGHGYVQGLTFQNIYCRTIYGQLAPAFQIHNWGYLLPMLRGEYPKKVDFSDGLKIALSQDVAFWKTRDGVLTFLRCDYIGMYNEETNEVSCLSREGALIARPYLDEVNVKIAETEEYSGYHSKAA